MGGDIWSQWLLHRRFGGDPQRMNIVMEFLTPIRETVLSHANLHDGDTVLDVGCGDGLLTFAALHKLDSGRVIFSDISQDLLDHSQRLAQEMGVEHRCEFLRASADDLSAIAGASINVVMTRSVLIYVDAKQRALNEFYRVLKNGGRLSIFEPINRFAFPEPDHFLEGYDVTAVQDIADKITALYLQLQPPESDPMLDFDERDLMRFIELAGFKEIHLDYQATIKPNTEHVSWEMTLRVAGNPKIPNLEEAMRMTLTAEEAQKFIEHLRPLVERSTRKAWNEVLSRIYGLLNPSCNNTSAVDPSQTWFLQHGPEQLPRLNSWAARSLACNSSSTRRAVSAMFDGSL